MDFNTKPLHNSSRSPISSTDKDTLLAKFLESYRELQNYRYCPPIQQMRCFNRFLRDGTPVRVDGQTLSITAVVAAARHCSQVQLDNSDKVRARVANSRAVISNKVDQGTSIYGVSTGFGGSGKSPRTSFPAHKLNSFSSRYAYRQAFTSRSRPSSTPTRWDSPFL